MVVAELKALAKKFKVNLPTGAKKSDIVDAVALAARKSVKATAPKAVVAKVAAKKMAVKVAIKKASVKVAVKKATVKVAVKKAAVSEAVKKAAIKVEKTAVKTTAAPRAAVKKVAGSPAVKLGKKPEKKLPLELEESLPAQEKVAEAKFYTGVREAASVDQPYAELPNGYGEEKIALMVRDPYVAHAYWEVTPARLEREKAWFGWNSKLAVRIYDITGVNFDGRNAVGYFDQEVYERLGNWYFDMGRPSHSFCAELGLLATDGRFLSIARSNYITMPRDSVSEVLDEEWMQVDEEFWKMYGFPGGATGGLSSKEVREMWERMRLEGITSPGMSSREKAKRK